jgi:hypothetical protein
MTTMGGSFSARRLTVENRSDKAVQELTGRLRASPSLGLEQFMSLNLGVSQPGGSDGEELMGSPDGR